MNRTLLRAGALAGAATLATVTAAPGYAATVSKASAAALTVEVAGEGSEDSGRVTATNDGSGQEKSGTSNPPISVLQGQDLLNVGTLAQDAEARVVDGQGRSAACAGIAGDGASLAEVGESFCLSNDGESIGLTLGNLGDLTDVQLADEDSALAPLNEIGGVVLGEEDGAREGSQGGDQAPGLPAAPGEEGTQGGQEGQGSGQGSSQGSQDGQDGGSEGQLEQQLPSQDAGSASATPASYNPGASSQRTSDEGPTPAEIEALRGEAESAIEQAIAEVNNEIGPIGVTGSFGVLQSTCQAGPGLSGDANLADAGFFADVAGERVALLSLPVNPAPNTKVATDLGKIADLVVDAVQKNLNQELDQLNPVIDQVQDEVVGEVLSQVSAQLGPLEDNILQGTLNKQSRSAGTIDVTALDLEVLPAAKAELGAPLASVKVANVTCGGGEQAATAAGAAPQAPQVPTVVTSGEQGSEGLPTGVVAGLLALLGAAGLVGYRRALGR